MASLFTLVCLSPSIGPIWFTHRQNDRGNSQITRQKGVRSGQSIDIGSMLSGTLRECKEGQGRNTSVDPLGFARDKN